MSFHRVLLAVGLIALLFASTADAQQSSPPKNPLAEPREDLSALDQINYRNEALENYRKEVQRLRRMREMESWDTQRRIVKREILNVHCTWKRPKGKTVTKVFKHRIASSCKDAVAELSRDLGGSLSAECNCTGTSPTSDTP